LISVNRFWRAAAIAAALCLSAHAASEVAVPRLAARVTDQTGTLDATQRAALESKLAAFEAKKGSQIAVLIVPTTRPETIEQYSIRVVDQWKLGRKGIDDGALLLVAKDDRRLRIEVGRGLEGVIPDAVANRIVNEDITPRFKEGNFYAGITAGVERMIRVTEGEPLPAPKAQSTGATRRLRDRFDRRLDRHPFLHLGGKRFSAPGPGAVFRLGGERRPRRLCNLARLQHDRRRSVRRDHRISAVDLCRIAVRAPLEPRPRLGFRRRLVLGRGRVIRRRRFQRWGWRLQRRRVLGKLVSKR
jgi:uncharacterized membrane protein YgcG